MTDKQKDVSPKHAAAEPPPKRHDATTQTREETDQATQTDEMEFFKALKEVTLDGLLAPRADAGHADVFRLKAVYSDPNITEALCLMLQAACCTGFEKCVRVLDWGQLFGCVLAETPRIVIFDAHMYQHYGQGEATLLRACVMRGCRIVLMDAKDDFLPQYGLPFTWKWGDCNNVAPTCLRNGFDFSPIVSALRKFAAGSRTQLPVAAEIVPQAVALPHGLQELNPVNIRQTYELEGAKVLIMSTSFTTGWLLPNIGFVTVKHLRGDDGESAYVEDNGEAVHVEDNWELAHLFTKAEERHKGHAGRLAQYALEWIFKQNTHAVIWAEASGDNVSLVKQQLETMGFYRGARGKFQKLIQGRRQVDDNMVYCKKRE